MHKIIVRFYHKIYNRDRKEAKAWPIVLAFHSDFTNSTRLSTTASRSLDEGRTLSARIAVNLYDSGPILAHVLEEGRREIAARRDYDDTLTVVS